jgi:hypothetical protein
VYKWQVFLGGIASATILVAGAAAPALAQTTAGSPLTNAAQSLTGSQVIADACNLGGLPMAGQVNSAVAGVTGQSCTASQGTQQASSTPADSGSLTSALPGLSAVTGEIPGLGSMSSSTLPAVSTAPNLPAGWTPPSDTAAAPGASLSNAVPGLGSSQAGTATGTVQNALNGITGTLPVSSLTGGLPDLGSVTNTLSGLTGSQG